MSLAYLRSSTVPPCLRSEKQTLTYYILGRLSSCYSFHLLFNPFKHTHTHRHTQCVHGKNIQALCPFALQHVVLSDSLPFIRSNFTYKAALTSGLSDVLIPFPLPVKWLEINVESLLQQPGHASLTISAVLIL